MVHKFFGFSTVLLLFLGLFVMPALCARGMLGLHHFHHAHHHLHQLHSSKTEYTHPNNIQMVTGKEEKSSSEANTLVRAPGHRARTNKFEHPNKIERPTHVAAADVDESDGVPAHVADSVLVRTSGCMWDGPNPTANKHSFLVPAGPNSIANRRSLLDPSSNSQNGEDLSLFLGSLTTQKDDNLFSMLPRTRVPPSGPSKSHNSVLTDKPS